MKRVVGLLTFTTLITKLKNNFNYTIYKYFSDRWL